MSTCNTSSSGRVQACIVAFSALTASIAFGQGATRGENGGSGQSGELAGAAKPAAAGGLAPTSDPAFLTDLTAAIEKANDPSSAVDAYAKARAAEPNDPRLNEVYVRRMVALGAPQLAQQQAKEVVQQNPKDGVAWAVLAFCNGAMGNTTEALNELTSAIRLAPEDEFVQYTAGQLLGWYDALGKASDLPPGLAEKLQFIKGDFGKRPAFADTYKGALSFYKQQQPGAQQQQTTAQQPAARQQSPGPAPADAKAPSAVIAAPPQSSAAPPEYPYPAPSGNGSESVTPTPTGTAEFPPDAATAPVYVETPVYSEYDSEYYPAYIVPTYPAWSVDVGSGWGGPWWGWGYPWWGGWGWGSGWWGHCSSGWYGHGAGWWGHGGGWYGHGGDHVTPYGHGSFVGMARGANGAYLAGGFYRHGGGNYGGFVAGGNAGRGGYFAGGHTGNGGGYFAAGSRGGSYPTAGSAGAGHMRGGPGGAGGRAGTWPSSSAGPAGPSRSLARPQYGSLANRSGGPVNPTGRGAGSRYGFTSPGGNSDGARGSMGSVPNANRSWPLARSGSGSRTVAGANDGRYGSAAQPRGASTTGYRGAGAPGFNGARSAAPRWNGAGRGAVTRGAPGSADAAPFRSAPSGGSSGGALTGAPRTSSGYRSMPAGSAPRTGGISRGAASAGGMRGFSGGSRAFGGGFRGMSSGSRGFSGGAMRGGGMRGGGRGR